MTRALSSSSIQRAVLRAKDCIPRPVTVHGLRQPYLNVVTKHRTSLFARWQRVLPGQPSSIDPGPPYRRCYWPRTFPARSNLFSGAVDSPKASLRWSQVRERNHLLHDTDTRLMRALPKLPPVLGSTILLRPLYFWLLSARPGCDLGLQPALLDPLGRLHVLPPRCQHLDAVLRPSL
jgi:hypothetical protein